MSSTLRSWAGMAACLILITGCSSPDYIEPNPPSEAQVNPDQQFNQLMQRPNLDEITNRYEEMRGLLKERLRAELSLPDWKDEQNGAEAGCTNEFPAVNSHDAGRRALTHFTVAQGVPADQWPKAKSVLSQVGGEYGFTKPGLDIAKPPYFDFNLTDEHGAKLSIATDKATVLALGTGCHLYPAAKQRGTPAP